MAAATNYSAQDITVLEGLEPVRRRPGMYIGGTDHKGLHHLVWEIVDNSVDEVINGYATTIEVVLDADHKGIRISDNGRGIPIDKHKKFKKSALELILTTLHAGGKFEEGNYIHSGGLHGVGTSVVNALASEMVVQVRRGGFRYEQHYSRGKPQTKVKKLGAARGSGTEVWFRPDPDIFPKTELSPEKIKWRLDSKAYLHRGLKIIFKDQATGESETYVHEGGIADFLDKISEERGHGPAHEGKFYLQRENGLKVEAALCWTEGTDEYLRSYVNGIPTTQGGTHESGFKSGIIKCLRNYMSVHDIKIKGVTLTADDLREGLVGILSIYIQDPQFQGQTKERLGNPEVQNQIDTVIRQALEHWLNTNQSIAEAIVARAVLAARARQASRAAAQSVTRKKTISHRLNLPGKLADCSSTDPANSELFIVEGDSAGGSAKQGRDRTTQAILPLRGKVLNAEQATAKKVLGNKELGDVVKAIGCGMGRDFDPGRLRYNKIILLMDADSDGHHISTLLLTFFYRHMRGLITGGHVYLGQPPLYKITAGKQTHWALDDEERAKILAKLPKNVKPDIMRFKGLGEMMPNVLKETTLHPKKRRLLQIEIDNELRTDETISDLMGKDPSARFRFIMDEAESADELDV